VALATRHASPSERAAIAPLILRDDGLTSKSASGCARVSIQISSFSRDYAKAAAVFDLKEPRCVRFASNGFQLLRRSGDRWKIIYRGSEPPGCKPTVPAAVYADFFHAATHCP
jgi:hypothetical protein